MGPSGFGMCRGCRACRRDGCESCRVPILPTRHRLSEQTTWRSRNLPSLSVGNVDGSGRRHRKRRRRVGNVQRVSLSRLHDKYVSRLLQIRLSKKCVPPKPLTSRLILFHQLSFLLSEQNQIPSGFCVGFVRQRHSSRLHPHARICKIGKRERGHISWEGDHISCDHISWDHIPYIIGGDQIL